MSARLGIAVAAVLAAYTAGCSVGTERADDRPRLGAWSDTLSGTGGGHAVYLGIPNVVADKRRALAQAATFPAIDPHVRILQRIASLPPDERVALTIDLAMPPPVSAPGLRSLGRWAELAARKQAVLDGQAPVIAWLESNGAEIVQVGWIGNQIRTNIPRYAVPALLDVPGVEGVSLPVPLAPHKLPANPIWPIPSEGDGAWGPPLDSALRANVEITLPVAALGQARAYDGLSSRKTTLLQDLLDERLDGRTGNRFDPESPIRIGVFEAAMLNFYHVGFEDCSSPNCPSRVVKRKDCSVFPCVAAMGEPDAGDPHGTIVSYVAVGDIEEGQDSGFAGVGTNAQIARSGHLPRAQLHFYTGLGSDSIANAIYQAAVDGVDVLNLSLQWGNACDGTFDASGINQALEVARTLGVLVTACAGNSGQDACTLWYPALRPDTLAINGLDTSDTRVGYGDLSLLSSAARGGVPIRVAGGWKALSPGVDLVAPGALRLFAEHHGVSGYVSDPAAGCSVATPVVSAAAGALKSAMHAMGAPTDSAELLMVNMLLMGDGWDAASDTVRRVGMSSFSGAGRLRMHWYGDLVQPAGWGMHSFQIHDGETHVFPVGDDGPESAAIQHWKWAALWFERDLQNVADIDFLVVDACPPGGGEQVLAKDISFGLRARFKLDREEIRERCLEMRVVGTSVPPAGRRVWMADYFHSGDPTLH